ncbi:MAG TPA: hypothetical protein VN495_01535 [Candidatus Paceibacterota bacterium]|nr:hypothetical protein [Candidatus Paceibacterota bacterium]
MTPLYAFNNRALVVAAGSIGVLFFAILFVYTGGAKSLPALFSGGATVGARSGTVYLSPEATAAAAAAAPQSTPPSEMHIANNGLVLLRGARVSSISGSALEVVVTFGGAPFTWEVETNAATAFETQSGEKGAQADIHVGDFVTITGMLAGVGTLSHVSATFIHE